MIFPNDNMSPNSKPWAREVTKQLSNVIDARESDQINNTARDNQLNSSIIAVAALAESAQNTADAVTAIVDNIYTTGTTQLDGAIMASGTLSASAILASTFTGTTITGATVQTGATGARVVMDSAGLRAYNASNTERLNFNTSTGALSLSGGSISGGSITGTSISGGTVQTASSGQRVTMSGTSNSIFFYDINGDQVGYMNGGGSGREGELILTGPATNYGIAFSSANTNLYGAGKSVNLTSLGISLGGDVYADGSYYAGTVSQAIIGPGGGVYPTNGTQTGTANVIQDASSAILRRVSSARRYKLDIQDVDYGLKALNLRPRTWIDKTLYEENGNSAEGLPRIPGFVAEEVFEAGLEELVKFNEDGDVESLHYDRMLGAVIPVIKAQQELITDLQQRIEILEGK